MNARPTAIPDVVVLEPTVFGDARGHFYESFNRRELEGLLGRSLDFVQDNQSFSTRGVLRGLHYQRPHPQGKLVRVARGEIFDVAVDLRVASPTFGRWVSERLSAENRRQLWIPEGFAHGLLVVSAAAEVLYKATDYWHREAEHSLAWDDPALAIPWPALDVPPTISPKDAAGLRLAQAPTFAPEDLSP